MTFSLRKLFLVAPVFIVVGIATACGPYGKPCDPLVGGSCPSQTWTPAPKSVVWPSYHTPSQPQAPSRIPRPDVDSPPAQAPQTVYYEPVTNAKGLTTYVLRHTYPARESQTILSATSGKIQVQTAGGARMTCEKLEILVNGVDPLAVSVLDGAIQVSTNKEVKDGSFVQASAKQVTRIGPAGSTLVLEGNAKLIYTRAGKKIDVSTDLLSVNLLTGQVISELNVSRPTTPCTTTPIPPTDCDTTAPLPTAPVQPRKPEATTPATPASGPTPMSFSGAGIEFRLSGPAATAPAKPR